MLPVPLNRWPSHVSVETSRWRAKGWRGEGNDRKKAYIKVSETIAIRVERAVVKIKKVGSDSIDVAHGTYEDVLDVELGWVDDLKCREWTTITPVRREPNDTPGGYPKTFPRARLAAKKIRPEVLRA